MKNFFNLLLSIITFGLYKYKKEEKKEKPVEFIPKDTLVWNEMALEVLHRVNQFRLEQNRGLLIFKKEDSHYVMACARVFFYRQKGDMTSHDAMKIIPTKDGVISALIYLKRIGVKSVGENLAWKIATPKGVVGAWKRSRGKWVDKNGKTVSKGTPGARYRIGHRELMLKDCTHAGVGVLPLDKGYVFCLIIGKK